MKWLQPWPFKPAILLDKSYDLNITLEYTKIDTCLDET